MTTETKQRYLFETIEDAYGTPEKLALQLDKAIEMLFYIEEDYFNTKDIRDVFSAIKLIKDALNK